MVINAFAVVEQQQGVSPYDHAIDVVNQDQEYYVQQVFPRGVKKLKIAANVYFSYYQGETWRESSADCWTSRASPWMPPRRWRPDSTRWRPRPTAAM